MTPEIDMRERLVPSYAQRRTASAILREDTAVVSVIAPLAMPGKEMGVWEIGQQVEHPGGLWTVGNSDEHRAARDGAEAAAEAHLGTRPGTVGYAVLRRGDQWSVFESAQHVARRMGVLLTGCLNPCLTLPVPGQILVLTTDGAGEITTAMFRPWDDETGFGPWNRVDNPEFAYSPAIPMEIERARHQ